MFTTEYLWQEDEIKEIPVKKWPAKDDKKTSVKTNTIPTDFTDFEQYDKFKVYYLDSINV